MKLGVKGLLLVSVPLLFQLIVVVTMSILLWHEQEQLAYHASARKIIASCNKLTQSAAEVARYLFPERGGFFDAGPVTADQLNAFKNSAKEVEDLLSANPAQKDRLAHLHDLNAKVLPLLYKARARKDRADTAGIHDSERAFVELAEEEFNLLTAIIETEVRKTQSTSEQTFGVRETIDKCLFAAVVVTVLLTICLAYVASVGIRKPLVRMAENAKRIARREPLHAVLSGSDELAQLDKLFHQVDDAVEEALTQEHNLIDNAADVVCALNQHGEFRFINPFVSTLLHYEPSELVGKSIINIVNDQDCQAVDAFLNERHVDGKRRTFELQLKRKDQEVVDTSLSAIWSERDQSLFCVIHDITERKQLERLKQDYIAMISHDLRTPLMSVHSSIELVQSGAVGTLEPVTATELAGAGNGVEHLIELVNDLLDFEKLEAGRMDFQMESSQLSELLDEAQRLIKSLSDERGIEIKLPHTDLNIFGDRSKLLQVLVNFLSNALKHSEKGGLVIITCNEQDDVSAQADADNAVASYDQGDRANFVEVSVHDEGPGVPEDFAKTIFAPFEQIGSRRIADQGTGLGLAICKLIVEGHHGRIGVRSSKILRGSEFYFMVPR